MSRSRRKKRRQMSRSRREKRQQRNRKGKRTDFRSSETGAEARAGRTAKEKAEEPDIDGDDEELKAAEDEMTYYQKNCFLKYGYEEVDDFLDLEGTASYLAQYGYDHNPLQQVRDNEKAAEEYAKAYDPNKAGAHFCDFCGVELAGGEYDVLKDGRERCNHCSSTALRTGEQFKEIFKIVMPEYGDILRY